MMSSTNPKVRIISYSIINNTTRKYCSVDFTRMVTLYDLIHSLKSYNHFVQHDKKYHRKVLLTIFHLYRKSICSHPQVHNLEFFFMFLEWNLVLKGTTYVLTLFLTLALLDSSLIFSSTAGGISLAELSFSSIFSRYCTTCLEESK